MIKEMHLFSLLLECHIEITICLLDFFMQQLGLRSLHHAKTTSSKEKFQKVITTLKQNAYIRMPNANGN